MRQDSWKQKRAIAFFLREQDGAVTVDWIVLTAVIVGLGLAAGFTVGASVPHVADSVSDYMVNYDVGG